MENGIEALLFACGAGAFFAAIFIVNMLSGELDDMNDALSGRLSGREDILIVEEYDG